MRYKAGLWMGCLGLNSVRECCFDASSLLRDLSSDASCYAGLYAYPLLLEIDTDDAKIHLSENISSINTESKE